MAAAVCQGGKVVSLVQEILNLWRFNGIPFKNVDFHGIFMGFHGELMGFNGD